MSLPTLKPVTRLSPIVTRILGGNPGKYTLQGTNTYLIGPPHSLLLVDTGSPETSSIWLSNLQEALDSLSPSPSSSSSPTPKPTPKPKIKDILLTHWHEDHVGGLSTILKHLKKEEGEEGEWKPTIWKFKSSSHDSFVENVLKEDGQGLKINYIEEGKKFTFDDEGGTKEELEVIHTPGHTDDSICLYLSSPSSSSATSSTEPIFFTADTVLGHGTAVFTSLFSYLQSLNKLLDFLSTSSRTSLVKLYPGHGEVIEDGKGKLEEYVKHRLERENQVLEGLKKNGSTSSEKGLKAADLTNLIYAQTIPISLHPAATRGLLLHLEKLEIEGKVKRVGGSVEVEEKEKEGGEEEERVLKWWEADWVLVDGEGEEDGRARM